MPAMNKSVLARRRRELEVYGRVLPSLDLKRRQLAAMLLSERQALAEARAALTAALESAARRLPMLAGGHDLLRQHFQSPLLDVAGQADERLLGLALPPLPAPDMPRWQALDHGLLGTPAWLDLAGQALNELATLALQILARQGRISRLETAVRRTLQRVNLFEKVLIPKARADIHTIRIFLADAERAAIVRAKRARTLLHRGVGKAAAA